MSKMKNLRIYLLILTVIFFLIAPITADIRKISIINDSRPLILLNGFCFTGDGQISITPSSSMFASSIASNNNLSRQGFFTIPSKHSSETIYDSNHARTCILDHESVQLIATLNDFSQKRPVQSKTVPITTFGEHKVYFANCDTRTDITIEIVLEMYSVDAGGDRVYVGYGDASTSKIYVDFLLVPCLEAGAYWLYICYRDRRLTHKIHKLMTTLIATKTLSLLFASQDKENVKLTGQHPDWFIYYRSFEAIHGVLFTVVIMLIGTGWSFFKSSLHLKEEILLIVGVVMKLLHNSIFVLVDQMGPWTRNYFYWQCGLFIVDICNWAILLLPFWWSVKSLKEAARTRNAVRTLEKMSRLTNMFNAVLLWGVGKLLVKIKIRMQLVCGAEARISVYSEILLMGLLVALYYMMRPARRELAPMDDHVALAIIRREF